MTPRIRREGRCRLRAAAGRRGVDRAATVVSNLADYGFVWVLLAGLKARRRGPDRRRAVVALGAAGVSSLVVSRAAKAAVERQRPEEQVDAAVRTPTSSSFPSGHTLGRILHGHRPAESTAGTAACVAFASAVAVSRVHLRAHHATDVLGGAAIGGAGTGAAARGAVVTPGIPAGRMAVAWRAAKGMGQQEFRVATIMKPFAVTWDYRCPFARNAHEHLVAGIGRRGRLGRDVPPVRPRSGACARRRDRGVGRSRPKRPICWRWRLESWCEMSTPINSVPCMRPCLPLGTIEGWTCGADVVAEVITAPASMEPRCSTEWPRVIPSM